MAKACEECTQNCLMMHKKNKNPDRVTTTFFKVMFGDDYSKYLFLPPRFARSQQDMVGKTTKLEDSNGEKWEVKFTRVDGVLAFEEGWNKFAVDHKLEVGDFLVFHYIKKSSFVVLMYGQSGCPENRHFGFSHQQPKETEKKNNLITDGCTPSNVNTNGRKFSRESSSQSEHSVHEGDKKEIIKKKGNDAKMTPNVNTNRNTHLSAQPGTSGSDKETCQGSEPLVRNTSPDNMVSGTPTTLEPFCLVDNDNGHVQEECTKNVLQPEVVKSDGVRRNNAVAGGGGSDETEYKNLNKKVETPLAVRTEKRKTSPVMQSEATEGNSSKKRLRNTNVPITPARIVEKEPDTSGSRLQAAIPNEPATDQGSIGRIKEEPKDEPDDSDEPSPPGSSSISFSAVMRSYKYLELPHKEKLKKPKVILLKNGDNRWAVLWQTKYGINALTQTWEVFAKKRGIKPGDNCKFVLESNPSSSSTCSVYSVHVTHS